MEPNPITNIDDIRMPSLPSYPFPLPQVTVAIGTVTDVAADMAVGVAMMLDRRSATTLLSLAFPQPLRLG